MNQISIYVNEEVKKIIQEYCDKTNQKVSPFLIRLALKEIKNE
jgi:hypothetical protein